jgi:hypothetical protein
MPAAVTVVAALASAAVNAVEVEVEVEVVVVAVDMIPPRALLQRSVTSPRIDCRLSS